MNITRHTDGTVSIRVPASGLQGRGLGADDILHGLRQAATLFDQARINDLHSYGADYARLCDTFQAAADELQAALS